MRVFFITRYKKFNISDNTLYRFTIQPHLTFWRDPWNSNRAPLANAGPDQQVNADADGFGTVVLDASATTDPDGDTPLQYWWMVEGELLATGVQPTARLPVGRHEVQLVVRDPADSVGTDEVVVVVHVPSNSFIRADSNADGTVDISDAINTLGFLFTGSGKVTCQDAADANDDGAMDISDAITTLGFLFLGTPSTLPAPYPVQGSDLTKDGLGC